ncbi:MAG: Sec-independent protein translocase subunit TatA/TatB, partial [Bdellovibrionales bacterium]
MFGLSFTHLVLLAIIVLVFIGPEQLPEVARTFARLLNEWKRASSEIQGSLTNTFKEDLNLGKIKEDLNLNKMKEDLNVNRMIDPHIDPHIDHSPTPAREPNPVVPSHTTAEIPAIEDPP